MTLEEIVKGYSDTLSECPDCGSKFLIITETSTKHGVFHIDDKKLVSNTHPIINYQFKCSACPRIIYRDTIQSGSWQEDWDKVGDVVSNRRRLRLQATVRENDIKNGKKL